MACGIRTCKHCARGIRDGHRGAGPVRRVKFGSLVATGETEMRRDVGGHWRRWIEVICPHKVRKWVLINSLRDVDSPNCLRWSECAEHWRLHSIPKKSEIFG